jgi:hypothetical protein
MRAAAPKSLSAWTYLRRNPRRVVPVALVQALVTALLLTMITPTNIFDTTNKAYVRVLETFTIVTPRIRSDFDDDLLALLDANPAQERRVRAKVFWMQTPMIVGEAYVPLVAIDEDVQAEFQQRIGNRLVRGKLPAKGTDEAAIHTTILRARGLQIGDTFGQLVNEDDGTPGKFTIVGEIDGDSRLGVVDLDYASNPFYVLARRESFQVVYAKPGRKAESDAYLHEAKPEGAKDPAFRVVDEAYVRRKVEKLLKNLPLLIGFLTGAVALIVALVTALLNVIAFQARVDEFGLYLAVGHRRSRLTRKLALETGITSTLGWLAGLGLGYATLAIYRSVALEPKGILMDLADARALLFSLAVPVLSAAVSATVLTIRLHRMDPVAVIQRRGA